MNDEMADALDSALSSVLVGADIEATRNKILMGILFELQNITKELQRLGDNQE